MAFGILEPRYRRRPTTFPRAVHGRRMIGAGRRSTKGFLDLIDSVRHGVIVVISERLDGRDVRSECGFFIRPARAVLSIAWVPGFGLRSRMYYFQSWMHHFETGWRRFLSRIWFVLVQCASLVVRSIFRGARRFWTRIRRGPREMSRVRWVPPCLRTQLGIQ